MENNRMEDNSENTGTASTPAYLKIERLIDSRLNQIEKKFLDMEKKTDKNNYETKNKLSMKSIYKKLNNSEDSVIKPSIVMTSSVQKNLDKSIFSKIISDTKI